MPQFGNGDLSSSLPELCTKSEFKLINSFVGKVLQCFDVVQCLTTWGTNVVVTFTVQQPFVVLSCAFRLAQASPSTFMLPSSLSDEVDGVSVVLLLWSSFPENDEAVFIGFL